ncbi:MAG: FAD-dependent oxidoreductase, partial [Gemmatimonadales bacterium]
AHDESIGIRGVERFLGDFGLKLAGNPVKQRLPPLNGKKVAIVGSGPGGLGCAYHLRRMGYASVIFEALDKPGGMLRAGIPAWHLPGEVLDAEIAKLLDLGGIEIRCGARVGGPDGELTLDELADRHDAVFLALGQDVGRRLEAEGAQARGVIGALEFLRETGLGRPVQSGKNVLVIGGGNTACDIALETAKVSARTCLSMRRGYYFLPKFILGLPTDVMYQLLRFLPRRLLQKLVKAYLWTIQGRNDSQGLQAPDNEPLEHHPNLNSHIFRAFREGRVHPRPDATGFEGQQAHFAGGGSEEFDVVVAATGYRISFPFLAPGAVELKDGAPPQLYLFVFPPSRRDLFFIGLVQPIGCIWPLSDLQARLVAEEIRGRWKRPRDIEARILQQAERSHYSWANSPRHS